MVRLPALRLQQRRRGRQGYALLQPLSKGSLCRYAGVGVGVQHPAHGGGSVRTVLPCYGTFAVDTQKCTAQTVVPWLLLFGIFGMALLRCA